MGALCRRNQSVSGTGRDRRVPAEIDCRGLEEWKVRTRFNSLSFAFRRWGLQLVHTAVRTVPSLGRVSTAHEECP